jgi:hypothetical protein
VSNSNVLRPIDTVIVWVLYDIPEEDRTCFACIALASQEEDVSVHAVEFFDSSELALIMDDGPTAGDYFISWLPVHLS